MRFSQQAGPAAVATARLLSIAREAKAKLERSHDEEIEVLGVTGHGAHDTLSRAQLHASTRACRCMRFHVVCAAESKETRAHAPRAMTDEACRPTAWKKPMGASVRRTAPRLERAWMTGALRTPEAQQSSTQGMPTESELSDVIQGSGKTVRQLSRCVGGSKALVAD